MFVERLKKWWTDNDGLIILFAAMIIAFVEYFYYFSLEPMNSDIYSEGLLRYSGGTRNIELACWGEHFYYYLTSGVVHPWFEHVIYTFCVTVSAICINGLWAIRTRIMRVLNVMVLMSAPAVTGQILYIYTYHSYAIAFLFAVLAVYVLFRDNSWKTLIPAAVLMSISLGFSSIYLGVIIYLVIGCLLLNVMTQNGLRLSVFFVSAVRCLCFGVIGVALYWGISKLLQALYHVGAAQYAGVEKVGVINTLMNIPKYIKSTYRQFAAYYREAKLGGNLFWSILILTALICIIYHFILMVREGQYWEILVALLLVMMIPAGANVMLLIVPEHGLQLHWTYPMQVTALLCISIIEMTLDKASFIRKVTRGVALICMMGLVVSYSFCAYSSFRTLDLGSRHIKLYVQNAITHAIEDEEYTEGMPIAFMGFVNDNFVQEKNPLRKYSYYERAYPFWKDKYEVFSVWPKYCWYNFGIDIGRVAPEQYESIIESEEFKAMEQYPSNKAFAIIDGCYVILMDRESVQE